MPAEPARPYEVPRTDEPGRPAAAEAPAGRSGASTVDRPAWARSASRPAPAPEPPGDDRTVRPIRRRAAGEPVTAPPADATRTDGSTATPPPASGASASGDFSAALDAVRASAAGDPSDPERPSAPTSAPPHPARPSAPTSAPPYAGRRSAPEPAPAPQTVADAPRPESTPAVLPQRVPAEPDVPVVPEPPAVEPSAETPELARIATHLRREDEPAPLRERPEGFDVNAILEAVRGVAGVRDAALRRTPAGAHSLRLDLADGADPAEVSRQVARLLQERMGLAAAPQNLPGASAAPAPPVRRRSTESRADQGRGPATRAAAEPTTPAAESTTAAAERTRPAVEPTARAAEPAADRRPGQPGDWYVARRAVEEPASTTPPAEVTGPPAAPAEVAGSTTPRAEDTGSTGVRSVAEPGAVRPVSGPGADPGAEPSGRRRSGGPHRGRASVAEAFATTAPVTATGSPVTVGASYSGGQMTTTETAPSRPLDTGGVPGPRVVIDHVQVSTFGLDATVEVRLIAGEETAEGHSTGPAVDGYVLRLCAVAAAAAVDELLGGAHHPAGRGRCFVEHAAVVPFGNCEVATVVVLLVCDGWVEQLAGSALVAGDQRQAVVRATLAAINRRLEALLA
ncbi:Daple [Micromonospora sp. NPDC050686]|uniref:Daple n=1 Tax=Micromonospora sp. NPDC050686 TaxID=3154631 RepID=UPI0033C6D2B4